MDDEIIVDEARACCARVGSIHTYIQNMEGGCQVSCCRCEGAVMAVMRIEGGSIGKVRVIPHPGRGAKGREPPHHPPLPIAVTHLCPAALFTSLRSAPLPLFSFRVSTQDHQLGENGKPRLPPL